MIDVVQEAIQNGKIQRFNLTFNELRKVGGIARGLNEELKRGRAILRTPELLDQYLYSLGLMTKYQWDHFFQQAANMPNGPVRIFDYGCGQGLATVLLFDYFEREFVDRVESVTLIELSEVALARANAILKCYHGSNPLAICKNLDDLSPKDLQASSTSTSIHLLSNVLDLPGFDHIKLLKTILNSEGRHCVFAISHDRGFNGGAQRFHDLRDAVAKSDLFPKVNVTTNNMPEKFELKNKMHAISWELQAEVAHGSF